MYAVTDEYLEEQEQDLRERSYVWVYLGLVNNDAQHSATATGDLADFSDGEIFGNSLFEAYYATAEQNFAVTNGTMVFMPEDTSLYLALRQGAVSRELVGAVSFDFSHRIDKISGLTIDFGDFYPTEFTVSDGTNTFTYTNDTSGKYVCRDAFNYVEHLTITPISMVGGQQRMRIHSVLFGMGFSFDNSNLISTKRTNKVSHLSTELPQREFSFTIDNFNQEWTIDNPESYVDLLKEDQIVQVTYGREVDNDIYKIPGGYMALQSWDSTHSTATFKAVGYLDHSTTMFYKGRYHPNGISLYDLAVEVLQDMGVTYKVDAWLKYMYTKNPLPIDLHKNCLQMIANAGQCAIYEDVNGTVTLKASIALPDYTVTVNNIENISDVDSLTDDSGTVNYAASEKDYSVTNDTLYFVDEINNPHPIGILSYLYPTDKEMSVTVELMAMWTWTGILFRFGVIYPQIITIEEYNSGVLRQVNDYVVTDKDFYLDHRFYDVDKIVVTFFGVEDNTRIHLNKMIFGNILSYCIKEHEMQELPKASLTDRVKNIYVKYYNFIQSPKTITATTIAEVGENLITIDKPCYEYVLEYSDETVQGILNIIESGAYYLIFTSTVAASVSVKAYQYERAENTISANINDTGNDITLENALISNRDVAERVLKWFEEYYKSDVAYTIRYRGEPALECNDRIFLENRFVNNNQILITDEEISTSTGMNLGNTVKALRLGYTEK